MSVYDDDLARRVEFEPATEMRRVVAWMKAAFSELSSRVGQRRVEQPIRVCSHHELVEGESCGGQIVVRLHVLIPTVGSVGWIDEHDDDSGLRN